MFCGQFFQPGAGIGNGEELFAALVAQCLVNHFQKVGKEGHNFDGSA